MSTALIRTARTLLLALAASWATSAIAQPPPHAPAHGWRAQNDPHYVGFSGRRWQHDYEVSSGRCNRQAIAAAVGGVVGGVLGSRAAAEHPEVGALVGVIAGALIGSRIGRKLDERDRNCVGHALEIGATGRPVSWANESTGVRYELVPGATRNRNGAVCREFRMAAVDGRARSSRSGLACQAQPGFWEIV